MAAGSVPRFRVRRACAVVEGAGLIWRNGCPHAAQDHGDPPTRGARLQIFARSSLSAFEITETDDRLIAAAAIIGESRMPNAG